jgi:hypothetical protein
MVAKITGRGGGGRGQGRKPVLFPAEREWAGIRCQQLWDEIGIERTRELSEGKSPKLDQLRRLQQEMNGLPARARKLRPALREGYLAREQAKLSAKMDRLFKRRKRGRVRDVRPVRPKGHRQWVWQKVAMECNRQIGIWNQRHPDAAPRKRVTPRIVESCWKDWRRTHKRLRKDLADYVADPNNASRADDTV